MYMHMIGQISCANIAGCLDSTSTTPKHVDVDGCKNMHILK